MKLLAALLLIGVTSAPAFAGGPRTRDSGYRSQGGYAEQEKCYRKEYREEYVPGTMSSPGYVRSYKKRVRVPCERPQFVPQSTPHHHPRYEDAHPNMGRVDNNSCVEGTVAGGLLGGALGGVLSKKDNWIWAIPSGMVAGGMIGCQVDGG
jgi:hypothetical protein